MKSQGSRAPLRWMLGACILVEACLPCFSVPTAGADSVDVFQKGPISFSARVCRKGKNGSEAVLPLFQVPVLAYKDKLELAFSGEAFDKRVTSADWSVIVVFLPKTVAPTSQGVVDFRLKQTEKGMVIPSITVPYDSVPMIFLIPDRNGRKKVLRDLNSHLANFRTLCAKIADLSEERASADQFLADLDGINKDLSPAQYDDAVADFLHNYESPVSGELQACLNGSSSNLAKAQLITSEFRKTNILVPAGEVAVASATPVAAPTAAPTARPAAVSSYVSILFDVASIISNLWPDHQFQYLPALARNVHGTSADLYYSDWIQTAGVTRGALVCCPGQWTDQAPPDLGLEIPKGESLLKPEALIHGVARGKNRNPFRMFGHDWKLVVTGPNGKALPFEPIATSPLKQAFVLKTAALLPSVRDLGTFKVKIKVVGKWGFDDVSSEPLEVPVAIDPSWKPTAAETSAFSVGGACTFSIPRSWAGVVRKVDFKPSHPGLQDLTAGLKSGGDGSLEATFHPKEEDRGPGNLEVCVYGNSTPALSVPVALDGSAPVFTGLEARVGETTVVLKGSSLARAQAVMVDKRKFVATPGDPEPSSRTFQAVDHKPLGGSVGLKVPVEVILDNGKTMTLAPVPLDLARPTLAEILLAPVETGASGLSITSSSPVAPADSPSLVSLLAAKDYRFPYDRAFRIAVRNAQEPSCVQVIPSGNLKVVGNGTKTTFVLNPAELKGASSGKLEVRVQDDHAGNSDWFPLPATFLDLPRITAIEAQGGGYLMSGVSLDAIDTAAPAPGGPWQKVSVSVRDGLEVADLTTSLPTGVCYLKLVGWGDLLLAVKVLEPVPDRPPAESPVAAHPGP